MKCENCKLNEACYHSTIIINGQKASTHLCEECAEKEGFINQNRHIGFGSLFDFFEDIIPYTNYVPQHQLDFDERVANKESDEVERLIDLRMELQKAIDEERYEDAGEINKKIKQMEKENK